MSRISQKQREEREAARRLAGVERRADRAISAETRRALDIRNGINELLAQFIAAIARAEQWAELAHDPHAELLEREALEDERVEREQDRILARNGVRWARGDWQGADGTAPIRRELVTAAEYTATEWVREERGRWAWRDDLALVKIDRKTWELRFYHAAGPSAEHAQSTGRPQCADGAHRYTGLLMPELAPAKLRGAITQWLRVQGADPSQWRQFARSRRTSGTGANPEPETRG